MGTHITLQERPRIYLDLESTGLDPATHEIIEIAIARDSGFPFCIKIKPQHPETAHPKALEVNGYSPEEWEAQGALSLETALTTLLPMLEDCVLVGYSVGFDVAFLEAAFRKVGLKWQAYYKIDVLTLAYEHLVPIGLQSLSLKSVCEFLGVLPEPKQHRASAGVETCRTVYQQLIRAGKLKRFWWEWKNRLG